MPRRLFLSMTWGLGTVAATILAWTAVRQVVADVTTVHRPQGALPALVLGSSPGPISATLVSPDVPSGLGSIAETVPSQPSTSTTSTTSARGTASAYAADRVPVSTTGSSPAPAFDRSTVPTGRSLPFSSAPTSDRPPALLPAPPPPLAVAPSPATVLFVPPTPAPGVDPPPAAPSPPTTGSADPGSGTPSSRSWVLQGGTVTVSCRGSAATLDSITAALDWKYSVDVSGPADVRIAFRGGGRTTQFEATCVHGQPVSQSGWGGTGGRGSGSGD